MKLIFMSMLETTKLTDKKCASIVVYTVNVSYGYQVSKKWLL